MACRDMLPGTGDIVAGIIEKQIGAEGFQKRAFIPTTQKQGLIQTYSPLTQGQNHPLMGWGRACRNQSRPDRARLYRKTFLQIMQGGKKPFEGATGKRLMGFGCFMGMECGKTSLLRYAFGLIPENHGISVESDAQFRMDLFSGNGGQDGCCRDAMLKR